MTFDPYRKWLSIPEGQRPPTHYQLLGIAPTEQDREVINAAVVRQSAFVRNFQTGKHAAEATRLLGEIAAAKVCLLDPARRAAYDAELRKRETAPVASPSPGNGNLHHSPRPSPAEFQPSASSQALVRHPSASTSVPTVSPAPSERSSPRADWSSPPANWSSPPPDWATADLPGEDEPPATEVLSVAPGMSFPEALWNEVPDDVLPTPPAPSGKNKVPTWLWGALAGVLGLVVVALFIVLFVKSAPPPDSPGRVQDAGEAGMPSPTSDDEASDAG